MTRRWKANETFTVSGIALRIVHGDKGYTDLRLEHRLNGRWVAVKMELALFLVDFFTENERELRADRSWWTKNGDTYFLNKCIEAVRSGWRGVADEIDRQRARSA